MSSKNAIGLGSQYFELIKESIPYTHQAEALIPMFKRLGFNKKNTENGLKEWRVQDEAMLYWMGCCCLSDIEAMWHLVQAGRLLCGLNRTGAIQMLQETIRLINENHPPDKRKADGEWGFDTPIKGLKLPKVALNNLQTKVTEKGDTQQ